MRLTMGAALVPLIASVSVWSVIALYMKSADMSSRGSTTSSPRAARAV